MTSGQPSRPANVENIIAINQGRQPLAPSLPELKALSPGEVRAALDDGARLVDTRGYPRFGKGHIPGALNIQLSSGEFEQRIGWVLPGEEPLLFITETPEQAERALKATAFIGLERRIAGYLDGGIDAWQAAGYETATLPQVTPEELEAMRTKHSLAVLDVREEDEYAAGHIRGATNMSYKLLEAGLDELPLDPDQPVAVTCAGGFRSSTASSILLRRGFKKVLNVTGGMGAWARAGLPVD